MNHDSPASIRAFLESRDIAPRKRWGQNFLINRGAREKIIGFLDVRPGTIVWEIGPGLGAMSESLLASGADLTVFEIDPAYCEWLRESLGPRGLKLIEGDVSGTWRGQWEIRKPGRILGNLPYNAASAIIAAFIESGKLPEVSVFTVQDEMGRRMTASPGTKDYSSFSILCQTSANVVDGGRLSPGSFYPAPRVHSRIIRLEPAAPHGEIRRPEEFRLLVRSLFSSRRKTLSNNIAAASMRKGFPQADRVRDAFAGAGIDLTRRPETVSPAEWVAVSNGIVRA